MATKTGQTFDLLATFDAIADEQPDKLRGILRDAGVPEDADRLALAELAVAVAAVRAALTRWTPRPPFDADDQQERDQLTARLAVLLDGETQTVAAPCVKLVTDVTQHAVTVLQDWNRKRPVHKQVLTAEQREQLRDRNPAAGPFDEVEVVDEGGGKYHNVYRSLGTNDR